MNNTITHQGSCPCNSCERRAERIEWIHEEGAPELVLHWMTDPAKVGEYSAEFTQEEWERIERNVAKGRPDALLDAYYDALRRVMLPDAIAQLMREL